MALSAKIIGGVFFTGHLITGGRYQIRFLIKNEHGEPLPTKRVRLIEKTSGRVAAESWSNQTGGGVFERLAFIEQGYAVHAYNNTTNPLLDYPAIADFVTPEPMP